MKSVKMNLFEKLLIILSFSLITAGGIILTVFLLKLSGSYSLKGANVLLQETGQVGDFIGGLIGSLWTLASVFLFYLAIRLQSKELKNQINEIGIQNRTLESQYHEFHINRLTQIIYSQIGRIDSFMKDYKITTTIYNEVQEEHEGISAIYYLNNFFSIKEKTNIDHREANSTMYFVVEKYYSLMQLLEMMVSSVIAVERVLDSSTNLRGNEKNELKILLFDNINNKIEDIFKKLQLLLRLSVQEDYDNKLTEEQCTLMLGLIDSYLISKNKNYN